MLKSDNIFPIDDLEKQKGQFLSIDFSVPVEIVILQDLFDLLRRNRAVLAQRLEGGAQEFSEVFP